MMENFIEFKKRIRKACMPRKYKIRNSWGVLDYFRYYRKNRPDSKKYVLNESQFFAIIRQVNNMLVNEIASGNDVSLPYRMGTIEVRKFERAVKLDKDGNVVNNLPIDWNSTLKLWYEDEEAYKNRTLIKLDENEIYKIIWNKENVYFNNRSFYEFVFNRELKLKLKHNIKAGIVDALHIGRRNRYVE